MNGKELLLAFIRQAEKVDSLKTRLIEFRSGASITTRSMNDVKVDHSNTIERRAEKYAILSEMYDVELARLFAIESKLMFVIGKIRDNVQATFIMQMYVLGKNYNAVAESMHYSTQQLRRINTKSLQILTEIECDL